MPSAFTSPLAKQLGGRPRHLDPALEPVSREVNWNSSLIWEKLDVTPRPHYFSLMALITSFSVLSFVELMVLPFSSKLYRRLCLSTR